MAVPFRLPTIDEARSLGRTLRCIDPRLLKTGPGGGVRWWTGGEPYLDVTLERRAGVLVDIDVAVRGHVVHWDPTSGIRTGRTDEHMIGGAAPQSRLVAFDAAARVDVVAVVGVLLSSSDDPDLIDAAAQLARQS
jgi:hypothetical protein